MFAIDPKSCTACKICQDACPCGAIDETPDGSCCVIDQDLCAECGACLDVCEFGSVLEAQPEEITALITAG